MTYKLTDHGAVATVMPKPMLLRNQLNIYSVLVIAVLLLLADIGLVDTAKILIVCLVQVCAGAELVERFFYRRPLTVFEKFGLGLPIGVAISVGFDLLFVGTAISRFGWLIPLVLIFGTCRFAQLSVLVPDSVGKRNENEALVWVAIGLLALLGQEWFWPMPVAVLASLAALIHFDYFGRWKNVKSQRRVTRMLGTLGLVSLMFGVFVRPYSWWIEDSDFGFYEALTISLSKWGTAENLLATGAGLRYHWFVYEWSGLVSKTTSLTEWVMLSRGVIIIGSFSLVCLIWSILTRIKTALRTTVFSLLLICFFDSVTSWGSGFRIGFISSPSQLVGFCWLFAILLVVLDQDAQRVKFSSLLYAILFSGAMLSKISHGVVALGGLLTLLLIEVITPRKILVPRLVNAITATGVSAFWFWHTYLGAENARFKFLKFPEQIIGSLVLYSGRPLWLAAVILLLGLVGYQVLGLVVGLANKELRNSTVYSFTIGVAVAGLTMTLSIESLFGSQLYFLHSASSIVLVVTAITTTDSFFVLKNEYSSYWRIVLILIVGSFSAAISWALPMINSGSISATWLSVSRSGTFVFPMLVAILLVFPSSLRNVFKRYVMLCLVGLSALGFGFSMTNWAMVLKREFPSFDRNEQFNLGTADLNSAMAWIKNNTDDETIFVSNNESFLLSALSHRRGLLQAEEHVRRHTVLDKNWREQLETRRELVDRAFRSLTRNDLEKIQEFGVTILVLDKSVPEFALPDQTIGLSTLYENPTYVVLAIA